MQANARTSLAVQWLRLRASNAGGAGSIPGWGTRIPHAAQHGKKILKKVAWLQFCLSPTLCFLPSDPLSGPFLTTVVSQRTWCPRAAPQSTQDGPPGLRFATCFEVPGQLTRLAQAPALSLNPFFSFLRSVRSMCFQPKVSLTVWQWRQQTLASRV